jgi:hypothetical protein
VRVSARPEGADVPAAGDDVSVVVRGTALAFPAVALHPAIPEER